MHAENVQKKKRNNWNRTRFNYTVVHHYIILGTTRYLMLNNIIINYSKLGNFCRLKIYVRIFLNIGWFFVLIHFAAFINVSRQLFCLIVTTILQELPNIIRARILFTHVALLVAVAQYSYLIHSFQTVISLAKKTSKLIIPTTLILRHLSWIHLYIFQTSWLLILLGTCVIMRSVFLNDQATRFNYGSNSSLALQQNNIMR